MANVSLSQTTLNVPNTSGQTVINVAYTECDPMGAYLSEGLVNGKAEMSRMGDFVVISWDANNSNNPRTATLTVEGWDRNTAGTVSANCVITQSGNTPATMSLQGPSSISGDTQVVAITASCTLPGDIGVAISGNTPWVTVNEVRQTTNYSAIVYLRFSENTGSSRNATVVIFSNVQNPPPYQVSASTVITQGTYTPPQPAGSEFYYSPGSGNVSYKAGTHTSPVPTMQNVASLTIRNVSGDMDITSATLDPNTGSIVIVYGANNGDSPKSATISVRATGNSGYINTTYTLYQGVHSYSFSVNPIWKTTTVDISGPAYVGYTVSTDGYPIYSGRAYQMPGEETISFELNEICRDYVDNYFWWREGYQTPSGWQRSFILESEDTGTEAEYVFTKDWSYKELYYGSSNLISLNDPIINEVPAGAYVPICAFSPKKTGSVSFTYTPGNSTMTAYTATLNDTRQVRYLSIATPGYKYGYSGNGKTNNAVYVGVSACDAPYVLYYENAFGGIDCMPINGNVTASDKITSYTTKNAVRVPSRDFAYRRYLNDTTKTWELRTRWLTDAESEKMYHLIESTMVFLYDIAQDELIPVVIDESTLTYKTYKNQGRKFYNYVFKVKESQNKVRK